MFTVFPLAVVFSSNYVKKVRVKMLVGSGIETWSLPKITKTNTLYQI